MASRAASAPHAAAPAASSAAAATSPDPAAPRTPPAPPPSPPRGPHSAPDPIPQSRRPPPIADLSPSASISALSLRNYTIPDYSCVLRVLLSSSLSKFQRPDVIRDRPLDIVPVEYRAHRIPELAQILLPVAPVSHRPLLLHQKLLRYPWTRLRRDPHPVPFL